MSTETTNEARDCAAMGATTEAHERFGPLVGTFKAEVKMWMGPGDPMVSTGVMTNEMELGGRFLRQVYKGAADGGPFPGFEGRGYFGYNTAAGRYEGFWIDTACTFFQIEHGQVDASGKVWTMHSEMDNPQTGRRMKKKSVITVHNENAHEMEMFFDMGDGAWSRGMHITYARA